MLENSMKQNLPVRILIFYGLQFVYGYMRLSMNTGNTFINQFPRLFFIIDIITFLLFAVFIIHTFRLPFSNKFFSRKTLGWLLFGVISLLFCGSLFVLLEQYLPPNMNSVNVGSFLYQFPTAGFFFGSIMAPVIEESIFRGIFFQLFFQKIKKGRPFLLILVSSLIFGSIHVLSGGFAWQNLLVYSLLGGILGIVYHFNRDLKVNILLHFAYNTAWQFAPFVFSILRNFLM